MTLSKEFTVIEEAILCWLQQQLTNMKSYVIKLPVEVTEARDISGLNS